MPLGGLQIFSGGMHLQPVTPGIADTGNAHIDGTLIANAAMEAYGPVPGITSNTCFGLGQTFTSGSSFNLFRNSTFIGENISINQNPNANLSGEAVVLGRAAKVYQGHCVVLGSQAQAGDPARYPASTATSVVVGYLAKALGATGGDTDGEVVIGAFSSSTPGSEGSVIVGPFNHSDAGFGHNFVFGKNIVMNAANCVVLGAGTILATLTITTPNVIVIGNNTHTKIIIGGIDFSNGMAASCKNIADTNYTALTRDNAIEYTSLTAARIVSLIAANAVPAGFRLIVLDASGSASGVNTITLARAGTDTINGAISTAISTPYGCRELLSDGVSKWTIIRTL